MIYASVENWIVHSNTKQRKGAILPQKLQNYALNQPDEQGNKVELDAGRLKAIDMLLNKTLPNLKAIEINNKQDNIMPVLKISLAGERKA